MRLPTARFGGNFERNRGSWPRLAWADLLHGPAVSVGIAEKDIGAVVATLGVRPRHHPGGLEMLDIAHVHPPVGQLGPGGLDVGDDEVEALRGARRRLRDPDPDGDRT